MAIKPAQFMREVRAEARKVTWPSFKETRMLTLVVFIFAVILSLFLTTADFAFSSIVKWVIGY